MTFCVHPLPAADFAHLNGASAAALKTAGAIAVTADVKPGYPCRITLQEAEPGERLFLVNYEHMRLATPYRSAHAVFVREGASEARLAADVVPETMTGRLLSVRGFDASGMMTDAEVVPGKDAAEVFERLLGAEETAVLHVHTAARGCYLARVESG